MALKYFNPTTPGQRQLILVDRSDLWKGKPEKSLTEGKLRSGGRNNLGRITSFQRGGGHKQRYRLIDFKRSKDNMIATIERLEYDPNRTAFIALIQYEDGQNPISWHPSACLLVIKLFPEPRLILKREMLFL